MKANNYLIPVADTIEKIFPEATRQTKKFKRKGKNIEFGIQVKKGNENTLESWQRSGCHTYIQLTVSHPALNAFFNLDEKEYLLNGFLKSDNFENSFWHCDAQEEKVQQMCAKIEKKHNSQFEPLFQELDTSDMIERYLWTALQYKFDDPDWEIPEPASFKPFHLGSDLSGMNHEYTTAAYVYCLLKRNAWEDAEKVLSEATDFAVTPPKSLLQKLEAEIERLKSQNLEIVPLDHPLKPISVEEIKLEETLRQQEFIDLKKFQKTIDFVTEPYLSEQERISSFQWKSVLAVAKAISKEYDSEIDQMFTSFEDNMRVPSNNFLDQLRQGENLSWLKYCRTATLSEKSVIPEKLEWLIYPKLKLEKHSWEIPNLKGVHFKFDFSADYLKMFKEKNPNPESLAIEISDEDIPLLIDLVDFESLKKLTLKSTFESGFRDLVKSKKLSKLEQLVLDGELSKSPANWMAKPDFAPNLKELRVKRIDANAQEKLFPELSNYFPKLQALEIGYDGNVCQLPDSLKELTISVDSKEDQITSINSTVRLLSLDISGWRINIDWMKRLEQWKGLSSVKQLRIEFSDDDYSNFFSLLASFPCKYLEILILETGELGDEHTDSICKALKTFEHLKVLIIKADSTCKTNLSEKSAQKMLAVSQHLKIVSTNIRAYAKAIVSKGAFPNLEHLILEGYYTNKLELNQEMIKQMNQQNFPNLKFLNFKSVEINADGVKFLASSNLSLIGLSFDFHSKSEGFDYLSVPSGLSNLSYLEIKPLTENQKETFSKLEDLGIEVVN